MEVNSFAPWDSEYFLTASIPSWRETILSSTSKKPYSYKYHWQWRVVVVILFWNCYHVEKIYRKGVFSVIKRVLVAFTLCFLVLSSQIVSAATSIGIPLPKLVPKLNSLATLKKGDEMGKLFFLWFLQMNYLLIHKQNLMYWTKNYFLIG